MPSYGTVRTWSLPGQQHQVEARYMVTTAGVFEKLEQVCWGTRMRAQSSKLVLTPAITRPPHLSTALTSFTSQTEFKLRVLARVRSFGFRVFGSDPCALWSSAHWRRLGNFLVSLSPIFNFSIYYMRAQNTSTRVVFPFFNMVSSAYSKSNTGLPNDHVLVPPTRNLRYYEEV